MDFLKLYEIVDKKQYAKWLFTAAVSEEKFGFASVDTSNGREFFFVYYRCTRI